MVQKIISGGQSGADMAGLVAGRMLEIATGGTAPKGWRVEMPDGRDSNPALAEFGLVEHQSREYPPRTRQNVNDSDGTVWFGFYNSPGGKLTIPTCKKMSKPYIINPSAEELRQWTIVHRIETLNVAGNRLSDQNPHIYQTTLNTVFEAFNQQGDPAWQDGNELVNE